ncbi:hypothetical protein [Vibrio parahaemolyticus]|uniref:hypothetical protein n=1 Tax=Vibrio parahaemolyticus TaxID=670 RepID=UPI003891FD8A
MELKIHTKALIQSLIASQGAIVGGKQGSEKVIADFLEKAAKFEPTPDEPTIKNLPLPLLNLAKTELVETIPTAEHVKNWLLYEQDFSGITFYLTNEGELAFAYLIRSLDLSAGSQYYDNRAEALAYSEAYRTGDEEKLRIAQDALRANLPNKKLRYLHWIGNKPNKSDIEAFKSEHHDYFS